MQLHSPFTLSLFRFSTHRSQPSLSLSTSSILCQKTKSKDHITNMARKILINSKLQCKSVWEVLSNIVQSKKFRLLSIEQMTPTLCPKQHQLTPTVLFLYRTQETTNYDSLLQHKGATENFLLQSLQPTSHSQFSLFFRLDQRAGLGSLCVMDMGLVRSVRNLSYPQRWTN